ncbi:hypothetical protein SAMN04487910_3836 [Aquimarina amphilecti]|uniref:Uncharacterized protein n=1 Tax=Aquimarina amphilecti TaxID=1038014 RepID=A0A1H7US74_AQUAM|nr:DUF6090 family protein [Aquimarina amphilecti]SEL99277.1 hypothetical protein SAMN04487910_3836 [Aquimarina amphilecti]
MLSIPLLLIHKPLPNIDKNILELKGKNWKKYSFEFLSIFIAVISAFALNNWNDNRKDKKAEQKILIEIKNGLEKDLEDLKINNKGHKRGIKACQFWRDVIQNKEVIIDSVQLRFVELTRDFTSLQNNSGYETLKSKGLEIIENDSLRSKLISLYEYDYYTLRKLEEEYEEMQYQKNYFKDINKILAPNFVFDKKGNLINIETPIKLNKSDKNILMSYLMKIELNRRMVLTFYKKTEKKINNLESLIEKNIKR